MLPCRQVHLTQSAAVGRLGHVVMVPQRLRVVADKMLRASSDSVFLDAVDNGPGQLTGEQWVFAEALKIPAAARISRDVDSRPQDNLGTLELGLVRELLTKPAKKLDIPC